MPLFKRGSFRPNARVPKRKPDAGTAQHELVDKSTLDPGLDFSQTPIKITLGDKSMVFQDGSWISEGNDYDGDGQSTGRSNANHTLVKQLRGQVNDLEEENNMLKYKIEILLDMVALSNADLNTKENEIAALREKLETKGRGPKR